MVRMIPAHIENGVVVPDEPLPPNGNVTKVSICLEMSQADGPAGKPLAPPHPNAPGILKWAGILKDYTGNPKEDVRRIIAEKHL